MAFPLMTTQTLSTPAAPAAIWRALTRVDLWPTVLPALLTARLEPDGPLAPGQSIVTRATPESGASDITMRVVAAEAPQRLMLTIDDPAYRATTEYRIVATTGGTDLVVTSSLEAIGFKQTVRFILWQQRLVPMLRQTARERAQALIDLAERISDGGSARCRSLSIGITCPEIDLPQEARNTASCAMSFGSIIALIDCAAIASAFTLHDLPLICARP